MTRLFGQEWYVQVDGLDLSDVDLVFKVERSTARAPGTAEISLYNLNADTRAAVEAGSVVILRAGFADPPRIFRGDIRGAYTERKDQDTITTITARDGGRSLAEARMAKSYAPGTRIATVLRDTVAALEIGEGNLGDFLSSFALTNGSTTFPDGYVAAGPARRVLDAIIRGGGYRWSVQSGALQVQQRGVPLQVSSVVLASDSGLVGSPSWDETGRRTQGRRGTVSAQVLIQAGIEPGRKVYLQSERITGDFEVRGISYAGDTRGNDWTATLTLRPVA